MHLRNAITSYTVAVKAPLCILPKLNKSVDTKIHHELHKIVYKRLFAARSCL